MRILIWTGVTASVLIALIVIAITLVVWTLTPDRLTPLVNRYASEYLLADVNARRVELTFWHTFPRFTVEVDTLHVTSRALRTLPDSVRATLPSDADSLLRVNGFRGSINLASLMKGDIALYDVDINGTDINLVQADSVSANYLIMPPSEPEPEKKEKTGLPDISINSFTITGGLRVRYRIPADSIDCYVGLSDASIKDEPETGKPLYRLSVGGDAMMAMETLHLRNLPFSIDGKISWQSSRPMDIDLSDFRLVTGKILTEFSTHIDMTEGLAVRTFKARIPEALISDAMELLPEEHRKPLSGLDTDMSVEMEVELLKPYIHGSKELPSVNAKFKADASKVVFDRLNLSKIQADIEAFVDLAKPDASKITVNRLAAAGKAMDFTLEGKVSTPVSDPAVDARFDGTLTIQNLPSQLLSKLPCAVRGTIRGLADIKTRLSYLTPKKFHKAKIDGTIDLDDFRMAMTDGSMESYLRHAELKFGSSSSVTIKSHVIDSMLTASLNIDTIAVSTPGLALSGTVLKAGVGIRNLASSTDTTQINPIGFDITAHRLHLRSDSDSIRLHLADSRIAATLMRYEGNGCSPLLKALVKSGAMFYGDRFNRAMLRDSEADFMLHPKALPVMSKRRQARFDSIAARHPELTADSIMGLMRAQTRKAMADYDRSRMGREDIKVELDNSVHTLLRRWNASGHLRAGRVRVFTPYFPTRNSLSDLNLSFSTDSVVLRDTRLRLGQSDFTLNGSIHNITRALTSRHGSPFIMEFDVSSDTININQLTATMIRGAAFADKISEGTAKGLSDTDSEELLQAELDKAAADSTRLAVLVPSNINARFNLKAKHVLYADLWLHGLDGLMEVYDGAVNLDRLFASTNIGAVNFSALYSAPTVNNLSIATAMRIKRLNLRSVLDMMPEVDSLLPLLGEVRGIVDAELALTSGLDSMMNLKLETLNLALKISGDSLQLLDNETFRTIAKWMLFKKKDRNMIDHMDVELAIHDGYIDLYPFIFDMDRYRIGVRGSNDAAFNLNYHVAVIKSPIPFKFGINIKGTPDKMKIRLGKARINEKTVAESRRITDTVRVNLIKEIAKVFRSGVRATGSRGLKLKDNRPAGSGSGSAPMELADNFSHADSVALIQQGLIEKPAGFIMPGDTIAAPDQKADKPRKRKKKKK